MPGNHWYTLLMSIFYTCGCISSHRQCRMKYEDDVVPLPKLLDTGTTDWQTIIHTSPLYIPAHIAFMVLYLSAACE